MVLPQKDPPDQIERTSWRRNVNTTSTPTSKCSSLWFIKSPASGAVCFQIRLRRERKENETGSPQVRLRTKLCPCTALSPAVLYPVGGGHRPNTKSLTACKSVQSVQFFQWVRVRALTGLAASVAEAGCSRGASTEELSGGSSRDSEGLGEKSNGPLNVTCRRRRVDWGKPAHHRQRAALLSVFRQERERR